MDSEQKTVPFDALVSDQSLHEAWVQAACTVYPITRAAYPDNLSATRGIFTGCIVGLIMWDGIIWAVWRWL